MAYPNIGTSSTYNTPVPPQGLPWRKGYNNCTMAGIQQSATTRVGPLDQWNMRRHWFIMSLLIQRRLCCLSLPVAGPQGGRAGWWGPNGSQGWLAFCTGRPALEQGLASRKGVDPWANCRLNHVRRCTDCPSFLYMVARTDDAWSLRTVGMNHHWAAKWVDAQGGWRERDTERILNHVSLSLVHCIYQQYDRKWRSLHHCGLSCQLLLSSQPEWSAVIGTFSLSL